MSRCGWNMTARSLDLFQGFNEEQRGRGHSVLHVHADFHSCTAVRGEEPEGREEREAEQRGDLAGRHLNSHSCHRPEGWTFVLPCSPTPGDTLIRTGQHAGPGGQTPQEGDGDRVPTAVQESGWDRGRGGGGGAGDSGEFLTLKALWRFVFLFFKEGKQQPEGLPPLGAEHLSFFRKWSTVGLFLFLPVPEFD